MMMMMMMMNNENERASKLNGLGLTLQEKFTSLREVLGTSVFWDSRSDYIMYTEQN